MRWPVRWMDPSSGKALHTVKRALSALLQLFSVTITDMSRIEDTTTPSFTCDQCDRSFRTKIGVALHQSRSHRSTSNRSFQCDLCDLNYKDKKGLDVHKNRIHGIRSAKLTRKLLSQRSKCTTNFSCGDCDLVLKTSLGLKLHQAYSHAARKHSCPVCHLLFVSGQATQEHMVIKHTELLLTQNQAAVPCCPTCKAFFISRNKLEAHERRWHMIDEGLSCCPVCAKSFATVKRCFDHASRIHRGLDTPLWPNKCGLCEKSYPTIRGLLNHTTFRHPVQTHGPHRCVKCDRRFMTLGKWSFHCTIAHRTRKERHSKQSYQHGCKFCPNSYVSGEGLIYHMRHYHTGSSFTWKCGLCTDVFETSTDLRSHTQATHYLSDQESESENASSTTDDDQKPNKFRAKETLRFSRSRRPLKGYSRQRYHDGKRTFGLEQSTRVPMGHDRLMASSQGMRQAPPPEM